MAKTLHIVSFDIPFPPDYGGVIDVFNKIKYLHQAGLSITLHCFEYSRSQQKELEKYCETVYYYPRKKSVSFSLPYIVSSRQNKLLKHRLMDAEGAILLEGIHSTYYLNNRDLKNKNVWVRLHNVEHEYYHRLFKTSRQLSKKLYYFLESVLLKRYEKKIAVGNRFLAMSKQDAGCYQSMGAADVQLLPLFLNSSEVHSLAGNGGYCLYHGNLSVDENEAAVIYLIEEIFARLDTPLVISGKNPTKRIINSCKKHQVQLIGNPGDEQLDDLIKNAHIHVLPSFNNTGIKVKLLHALLNGRFVITNASAVQQEEWASLCTIASERNDFVQSVRNLMLQPFTNEMIVARSEMMEANFDPLSNTQLLIHRIFS